MMSILERKLLDETRDRVAQLEAAVDALKSQLLASGVGYDSEPVRHRKPRKHAEAQPA